MVSNLSGPAVSFASFFCLFMARQKAFTSGPFGRATPVSPLMFSRMQTASYMLPSNFNVLRVSAKANWRKVSDERKQLVDMGP